MMVAGGENFFKIEISDGFVSQYVRRIFYDTR
jgi:hypothetical protein